MNIRPLQFGFSAFVVPAKETSVENGGWQRIGLFFLLCGLIAAIVYGIAYDPRDAARTASNGILPFAAFVVIASLVFGSRWPLSKPRVDLIYYGLVALSAAILYLDNEDQRSTLQKEIRRQQIVELTLAIESQRTDVRHLASEHRAALDEGARTISQLLPAKPLFDELQAAASEEFERRKSANDRYCLSIQERCFSERIQQRGEFQRDDGRVNRVPRLNDCESQELACALMQSDKTSQALGKLSTTKQLNEAILDIDVEAVSDKNLGITSQKRPISIASSLASLQSLVRESQLSQNRVERLVELLAIASKRLKQLESRLEAIAPSSRDLSHSESASQTGSSTPTYISDEHLVHRLNIGLWAKFVWSWVLVTLLGLKLAREPFVFRRKPDSVGQARNNGIQPSRELAPTTDHHPAGAKSHEDEDKADGPRPSEELNQEAHHSGPEDASTSSKLQSDQTNTDIASMMDSANPIQPENLGRGPECNFVCIMELREQSFEKIELIENKWGAKITLCSAPLEFAVPDNNISARDGISLSHKEIRLPDATYLIIEQQWHLFDPSGSEQDARNLNAEIMAILEINYPRWIAYTMYEGFLASEHYLESTFGDIRTWLPGPPLKAPQVRETLEQGAENIQRMPARDRERFQLMARWIKRGLETRNEIDAFLYHYIALEVLAGGENWPLNIT